MLVAKVIEKRTTNPKNKCILVIGGICQKRILGAIWRERITGYQALIYFYTPVEADMEDDLEELVHLLNLRKTTVEVVVR